MEERRDGMEDLVHDLGGCGLFQILLTNFVLVSQVALAYSTIFMAFGTYNPGWRCLDNVINNTTLHNHLNETENWKIAESSAFGDWNEKNMVKKNNESDTFYTNDTDDSCQAFQACQRVYFNPEVSTIATEWGLICDRSWILSLIMSLQMVGTLLGGLVVGYLGDTFGRKLTLYMALAFQAGLQVPLIFSTSWQMFAGFRFVLGIPNGVISFLSIVYVSEFIVQKWRSVAASIPVWMIGSAIFSLSGFLLKDWRLLHVCSGVLSVSCFLPVIWVPESVPWLLVKGKREKAAGVVKKIARVNRVNSELPLVQISRLSVKLNEEIKSKKVSSVGKRVLLLQLFSRERFVTSIIVGVLWFAGDLIYFVTSFGVVSMPGDFFTNLIVLSTMGVPGNIIASMMPNLLGRKRTLVAMFLLMALTLFMVAATDLLVKEPDQYSSVAILILIILSRMIENIEFCTLTVYMSELYPTTIRSTANGYGGFVGSLGSILAPYLIPSTSGSFYISYVVMATVSLFCGLAMFALPETKGRQMPDT